MDKLCKSLNPNLDVDSVCTNWFHHASKHCVDVILHGKSPGGLWWSFKNYFFSDSDVRIEGSDVPLSVHPAHLTFDDCHTLFNDAFNDYMLRGPRYAKESETSAMLWQIIFSLIGICTLFYLLMIVAYIYKKCDRKKKATAQSMTVLDRTESTPYFETSTNAVTKRTSALAQYQIRHMHVQHLLQKEDLIAPDGSPILALRVSSKQDILNKVVTSIQSPGRLYKAQAEHFIKNTTEFSKNESVTKASAFLDKFPCKLRLLILFEEDTIYEDVKRRNKDKKFSPRTSNKYTTSSSLTHGLSQIGTAAPSKPNFMRTSSQLALNREKSTSSKRKQISPKSPSRTRKSIEKQEKKEHITARAYSSATPPKSVPQSIRFHPSNSFLRRSHPSISTTRHSQASISSRPVSHAPNSSTRRSHPSISTSPRSNPTTSSAQYFHRSISSAPHSQSAIPSLVHPHPPASSTRRSHPSTPSTPRSHANILSTARSNPSISSTPRFHSTIPSTARSHPSTPTSPRSHLPVSTFSKKTFVKDKPE